LQENYLQAQAVIPSILLRYLSAYRLEFGFNSRRQFKGDENWFTFYPSPTSLKLRISRMAQAPDAPQQEQIQALAAPQDAGQPAENLPVSPRRKNLRYLFSPFFFLSCFGVGCHVGLTLLVSVERQFLHVYVSPFGL